MYCIKIEVSETGMKLSLWYYYRKSGVGGEEGRGKRRVPSGVPSYFWEASNIYCVSKFLIC